MRKQSFLRAVASAPSLGLAFVATGFGVAGFDAFLEGFFGVFLRVLGVVMSLRRGPPKSFNRWRAIFLNCREPSPHAAPCGTASGAETTAPAADAHAARPCPRLGAEPGSFDGRRSVVDPAAVVRALAVPSRVAILAALADGPLAVGEIAERIERTIGTVSVHVSHLEEAGLVVVRRRGRRHLVRARWGNFRLVFDPAG